jgi:hypothetical protein
MSFRGSVEIDGGVSLRGPQTPCQNVGGFAPHMFEWFVGVPGRAQTPKIDDCPASPTTSAPSGYRAGRCDRVGAVVHGRVLGGDDFVIGVRDCDRSPAKSGCTVVGRPANLAQQMGCGMHRLGATMTDRLISMAIRNYYKWTGTEDARDPAIMTIYALMKKRNEEEVRTISQTRQAGPQPRERPPSQRSDIDRFWFGGRPPSLDRLMLMSFGVELVDHPSA